MENPWNIHSIYEFQFFNCPSCVFKNHSKQEFINHAFEIHPDFVHNLNSIIDNSLLDVICPWNEPITQIKTEDNENIDNKEIDVKDIKIESQNYDETDILEPLYTDIDPLNEQLFEQNSNFHEGLKKYHCEKCGKYFATEQSLQRHISSIHEGVKNHKCETCGKAFSQAADLKNHIRTIHEGVKNHKCDICGKAFRDHP